MAKKFPLYPWVEPKVKIGQPIFSPYEESPVARAPVVPRTSQLINPAAPKDNFLRGSKAAVAGPMPQIPIPTQRVYTSTPVPTATATPAPFRPQYMLEGLRENRVPTQVSLPAGVPTNYPTSTPAPPTATEKFIDDMSYEELVAKFPWMKLTPTLKPGESWIQDLLNSQQTATAEATNPKGVVTQTPHWWDPPPTRTSTAKPSATATATAGPSPTATPTATPSAIPTWKAPPNGFQTATAAPPVPFRPKYMLEGLRENRAIPVEKPKPKPKPVGPKGYQDPAAGEIGIPKTVSSASSQYNVTNPQREFDFIKDNGMRDHLVVEVYDSSAQMKPGNETQSKYDDIIFDVAKKVGLNPAVIKAVIAYESQFNPNPPDGGAGAKGLMQLMPAAIADMSNWNNLFDEPPDDLEILDPKINILIGAHYLKWLLSLPEINGNIQKAIGLYNAGPNTYYDPKTKEPTTAAQKLEYWKQPKDAMARGFDYLRLFQGLANPFTEERGGLQGGIKKDQGKFELGFQSARDDLSVIEKVPVTQRVIPVSGASAAVTPPAASTFLNMGPEFKGVNIVPLSTMIDQAGDVQVSANVNNALEQLINEWQQTETYDIQVVEGFRSFEDQGKIDPKYTKAKSGQSQHQTGYAFDIMFYDKSGNIIDSNNAMLQPLHKKFQAMSLKYGLSHPLSWDTPHYVASQTLLDEASPILNLTEQGKLMIQELGPKIKNGTITNSELNSIMQVAYGIK